MASNLTSLKCQGIQVIASRQGLHPPVELSESAYQQRQAHEPQESKQKDKSDSTISLGLACLEAKQLKTACQRNVCGHWKRQHAGSLKHQSEVSGASGRMWKQLVHLTDPGGSWRENASRMQTCAPRFWLLQTLDLDSSQFVRMRLRESRHPLGIGPLTADSTLTPVQSRKSGSKRRRKASEANVK